MVNGYSPTTSFLFFLQVEKRDSVRGVFYAKWGNTVIFSFGIPHERWRTSTRKTLGTNHISIILDSFFWIIHRLINLKKIRILVLIPTHLLKNPLRENSGMSLVEYSLDGYGWKYHKSCTIKTFLESFGRWYNTVHQR